MELKQIIKIASDAYDDGLVEQYFDNPETEHGDGLAQFIASELSETYEEDTTPADKLAEAVRVVFSAQRQLEDVVEALRHAEGALEEA